MSTVYSAEIKGDRGNYKWPVRFDMTDGRYLGITQTENGVIKDRVLLSPAQVYGLLEFYEQQKRD